MNKKTAEKLKRLEKDLKEHTELTDDWSEMVVEKIDELTKRIEKLEGKKKKK